MSGKGKRATRAKQGGLSSLQLTRLRRQLRQAACSEPWVDVQIRSGPGGGRFHDSAAFPPGGRRRTAMRWCRSCGRYTPAPCVSLIERHAAITRRVHVATLQCDDCRIADDAVAHRELYDACPHLRPAGSSSVVGMTSLIAGRNQLHST